MRFLYLLEFVCAIERWPVMFAFELDDIKKLLEDRQKCFI